MSQQSTPALPHLSSSFEMDSFFDLDQTEYTPTLSPTSRSQSTMPQRAGSSGSSFANQSQQQQMSGPSHQYDAYRQQTGLPAGGLASTFAINQANGMQYTSAGANGFVMPIETLNFPLPSNDEFDFNSAYDVNDMDFDADSPSGDLPAMFYAGAGKNQQFVNPSVIGGESSAYNPQVQRMYPGMHAQAAQAKAQQQKQQEMARQQHHRALAGQQPLPSSKAPAKNDPAVDERISRLLQQMRHNSAASTAEDDADTPTGMPSIARLKKEEDDMDEDERLLASEEGKKLSSKERRQLRNKVSARAFRSRRKGMLIVNQLSSTLLTHLRIHRPIGG